MKRPEYINGTFDYDDMDYLLRLKKREHDSILEILDTIMKTFKEDFEMPYTISKATKMTSDIDFSFIEKIMIEIDIGEKIHKIFLDFPSMDDTAMFMIHGVKRTPCIQKIDKPLAVRKDRIRFQSNVDIMEMRMDKNYLLKTTFLKSGIPFMLYLLATWGPKICQKKIGFEFNITRPDEPIREFFREDCVKLTTKTKRDDKVVSLLNSLYKYEVLQLDDADYTYKSLLSIEFWKKQATEYIRIHQKGTNLASLQLNIESILKIDKFTKLYMNTESVEDEILYGLTLDVFNEQDVNHKRIRCVEHMLSDVLKYLHTLYVNLSLGRRIYYITNEKTFKIDEIVIANRLSINEYQFNPTTQVSEYTKVTQIGPLGFIRNYFRGKRRDLHDSQKNYFCPVATPDRENCGVILNLVVGCKDREISKIYRPLV